MQHWKMSLRALVAIAAAAFALIALAGLVVDSVRETVGLLLGR